MHLGALCMQLRAPVSFYSLWEGQKWGFFHLIDKIADFLHNKRFSLIARGICIIIRPVRSLAQPCSVNNTVFSLWEGRDPKGKTPFLAFPEARKGVVDRAGLRKAAHLPNNNANPSGLQ